MPLRQVGNLPCHEGTAIGRRTCHTAAELASRIPNTLVEHAVSLRLKRFRNQWGKFALANKLKQRIPEVHSDAQLLHDCSSGEFGFGCRQSPMWDSWGSRGGPRGPHVEIPWAPLGECLYGPGRPPRPRRREGAAPPLGSSSEGKGGQTHTAGANDLICSGHCERGAHDKTTQHASYG